MSDVQGGTPAARRRKMFSHADQIGLTDEEHLELAKVLLWRDIKSRRDLTDDQVNRMLDALEGWILIDWLLRNRAVQRPPLSTALRQGPGRG